MTLDVAGGGARRASPRRGQPGWVDPMRATLTDRRFSDPAWVFERKLDGVRVLAFCRGTRVRLMSRNRKDLSGAYPELVEALQRQDLDAILDGEVVAFDGRRTSFARLQGRLGLRDPRRARTTGIAVFLYVFDLLHLDGQDTTGLPLRARKRLLRQALAFADPIRYTAHRNERGEAFFDEACGKGWEGLIAKRADAPYVSRRSRDWLKLKCERRQELVIGGYTDPKGSRERFGALLVGYYERGDLRYAGKVGTGFDRAMLARLGDLLAARERATPAFVNASEIREPRAHWVRPDLVAEIGFTEWTDDGKLRHPRFEGLRDDKGARDVTRERPA